MSKKKIRLKNKYRVFRKFNSNLFGGKLSCGAISGVHSAHIYNLATARTYGVIGVGCLI